MINLEVQANQQILLMLSRGKSVNDDTNRNSYDLSVKWQVAGPLEINDSPERYFFQWVFQHVGRVSKYCCIVSPQITTVI